MTEKEMVDRVVYLMTGYPTDEDYEEAHLLCDKLIAIKRERESVKGGQFFDNAKQEDSL